MLSHICILGDDGKEDALNVEDDDEQSADNSIKLTGKGSSSLSSNLSNA